MHYTFSAFDLLPSAENVKSVTDREFFAIDATFFLNFLFIGLSGFFLIWKWRTAGFSSGDDIFSERLLFWLALLALVWLAGGLIFSFVLN